MTSKCNRCKKFKDCSEFKTTNGQHRACCTECRTTKLLKTAREQVDEIADNLYTKQDGKCVICKTPLLKIDGRRNYCVDHCHETQNIRGLLCSYCNSGLGYFRDDIEALQQAIIYLNTADTGLKLSDIKATSRSFLQRKKEDRVFKRLHSIIKRKEDNLSKRISQSLSSIIKRNYN
jgi:Recombination endonuclease VII